jgi:hypothetical protein
LLFCGQEGKNWEYIFFRGGGEGLACFYIKIKAPNIVSRRGEAAYLPTSPSSSCKSWISSSFTGSNACNKHLTSARPFPNLQLTVYTRNYIRRNLKKRVTGKRNEKRKDNNKNTLK